MKLGLILECTQEGADLHVCRHLIKMINEQYGKNIQLAKPATLTNKPGLLQRCGESARNFLEVDKCDRIVILWDQDSKMAHGRENCLALDRKAIFAALQGANVDLSKVYLVGIKRELESWLIADGRAIEQCIREIKRPHPANRVNGAANPEEVMDPKSWISNVFRPQGISKYRDFEHAQRIIRCLPDFQRVKACETFVRFVLKVADVQL
ncbi:MAG: DUF4276 family protein [Chloroflexota bacterium]